MADDVYVRIYGMGSEMDIRMPNILLTLMVKNEGKILQRCLEAGARHADAVIVCDTGSTDNTREIGEAFTAKPTRVVQHEWKHFGHNRSLSFAAAYQYAKDLGWDLEDSYALVLDGDMVLKGEDPHPKLKGARGYRIIQKNGGLEYYNTRFMRLSVPWKCVGVTHEYWDGGECDAMEGVWIDDIGDGGAKADKYERDVRLLTQGLQEEPNNVRYMFYLAQTLKDCGKLDESIEWYTKRIAGGGWDEEVWYAHYMIAQLYLRKNDLPMAELWVQKSHAYRPRRNEALLMLVTALREKPDQQYKAWHYLRMAERIPKPNDLLFVETSSYDWKLPYEKTILSYYVMDDRTKAADLSIDYLAKHSTHADNVFANSIFYAEPLPCEWTRLEFPVMEPYTTSSISIQADGTMNVRTVNYRINAHGGYSYPDGVIDTRNYRASWDFERCRWRGDFEEVVPNGLPRREGEWIRGLEDVRIYGNEYTATTREFSYNEKNRIVMGTYPDMKGRVIKPPTETDCEKNWIPIGNGSVIYNWHPLRIGEVEGDQLKITKTFQTPSYFRYFRGSTPPFEYQGDLWLMVHLVIYSNPRKYMHAWVVLDKETLRPKSYSRPFTFKHHGIEYCIGAAVHNDELMVFPSVWDRESWVGRMPMRECVKSLRPISDA